MCLGWYIYGHKRGIKTKQHLLLNIFRVTSLCDPAGKYIPQCRSWFPCGTPREVTRIIFNNDVVLYSQLALILQHGSLTVHLNTKFDMMYPITNMWLIWMVSLRNHHRICICRFFVWLLFVPNSLTSYGDWLIYVLCEWFDVDKCFQSRYMLFECDEFYITVLELKETYAQANNSNLENDKKLSFCGETSNESDDIPSQLTNDGIRHVYFRITKVVSDDLTSN